MSCVSPQLNFYIILIHVLNTSSVLFPTGTWTLTSAYFVLHWYHVTNCGSSILGAALLQ